MSALIFLAAVTLIGLVTRTLALDRRMWPVIFGLGVAAILAPTNIMGGAFVHARLPAVIGCLLIAGLNDNAHRTIKIVAGLKMIQRYLKDIQSKTDSEIAKLETNIKKTR